MKRPEMLSSILLPAILLGAAASGDESAPLLAPGARIEGRIGGGEMHLLRVAPSHEARLLTIEENGVDLLAEALDPAGERLIAVESPDSRFGLEPLLLAPAQEELRLRLSPVDELSEPRPYVIYMESLPSDAHDRRAAALAMTRAGALHQTGDPDSRRDALALYRQAEERWRELGDRPRRAAALYAAAKLARRLGELSAARDDFAAVGRLWSELGERQREATALNDLGLTQWNLGDNQVARATFQRVRQSWKDLGERLSEAVALSNLCLVDHSSGHLERARQCYEEALVLHLALGRQRFVATLYNNLGGVDDLLGEPDRALLHYQRALELRRELDDRRGVAETLNNMGVIRRTLGQWQEARRVFAEARDLLATLDDPKRTAAVENNIGRVHLQLGEARRALLFFGSALEIYREHGYRRQEITTLDNLGTAHRELGDLEAAERRHREALELAIAAGNSRLEAVSRRWLGAVLLERERPADARRELTRSRELALAAGSRRPAADALQGLGRAALAEGATREARQLLLTALEERRAMRDRAGEVEVLVDLAICERRLGRIAEALERAEAAVELVEDLRGGFLDSALGASFFATRRRSFTLSIELEMALHQSEPNAGHAARALALSERARARSLLDVLARDESAFTDPASLEPQTDLEARRRSLRRRVEAKLARQRAAADDAEEIEREIERLLFELGEVENELRRQDPRRTGLDAPPSVAVEAVSEILDDDTLVLEYSLGPETSYLFAISRSGMRVVTLEGEAVIGDLVRRFHGELSTVETHGHDVAARTEDEIGQRLARHLLEPVWDQARRHRRLVIVPDGALHYLPFAALSVPRSAAGIEEPLLADHEVVHLPSAATLLWQQQAGRSPSPRRQGPGRRILVIADPVLDHRDLRVARSSSSSSATRAGDGFGRLAATRSEAAAIAGLAEAGTVRMMLGFDASREKVLAGALAGYDVVHIATHGTVDTHRPELSGLLLSRLGRDGSEKDGFLRLSDIYGLELDAGLVVLSGCETALGKEVRGEGLGGLARGFMHAGAPRVVASLWRVQDRATAVLMESFYRALESGTESPAAALRRAQLELRAERRYRDPYHWAGFVLMGDWQ